MLNPPPLRALIPLLISVALLSACVKTAEQGSGTNAPTNLEIKASHILVDNRKEAEAIIERLNNGEDFATLARRYSIGPSAPQGGDLGYFSSGTMISEFWDAAWMLQAGEHSKEPVKPQFGWHVIKVFDRRTIPLTGDARPNRYSERISVNRDGVVASNRQYPRPLPAPSLPEPKIHRECSDRNEVVRAGHILLPSREQAETIIAQLKAGETFPELAWRYSIGPSAHDGGDLGYFCSGTMIPEFWDGVEKLKAGEFSTTPVKTQFGWHVIKVFDRGPPPPRTGN